MKKQTDNTISLSPDFVLNELIWQATRYISTRSTYVTSYAVDYAALIINNRDKFNSDRLAFFGRDVRMSSSDRVNWKRNVTVNNSSNDVNNYDAYTLIAGHLEKNKDMAFADFDWVVDCLSGEVKAYKRESPQKSYTDIVEELYDMDMPALIKLANAIDESKHVLVTIDGGTGRKIKEVCVPVPLATQVYDNEKHTTVGYSYSTGYCPLNRITSSAVICKSAIIKVEPLNKKL